MKREKIFKVISTVTFWGGVGLAVVAIILIWVPQIGISGAACPVNNNMAVIIPAFVLLVTSFVTSFFTGKKKPDDNEK